MSSTSRPHYVNLRSASSGGDRRELGSHHNLEYSCCIGKVVSKCSALPTLIDLLRHDSLLSLEIFARNDWYGISLCVVTLRWANILTNIIRYILKMRLFEMANHSRR
jgi:hypothetical protein